MAGGDAELRRRISRLMLFRLVMITLVLAATVLINLASPVALAQPNATWLFGIVAVTYALTLGYAIWLPRAQSPIRFADGQIAADLAITTVLVHVTGGAQSGYVFFYPLSIIAAALVRYRRGAVIVAAASIALFAGVSLAGWLRWLPTPGGQKLPPWDVPTWSLVRLLVTNAGAFTAVAFLSAYLGQQLAHAGQRTADLTALNEDIIRCLSSGLVTIDPEGRVLTLNEAAAEILGVAAARNVVGRDLGEVCAPLARLVAEVPPGETRRRASVEAGGATLGVSVSPLSDHEGRVIGRVVNFQDVTELRRMEQQVKRAERLAVIGEMAAGVAHELRNPLAAISGSMELLRATPTVDDEHRALMEIVLREVDRLNGLVTDLLDYARPRQRMPVRVELAALLDETVRVFAQDRSTPRLEVTFAPSERAAGAQVHADPGQLRQVVWNLLRNAVEAMPDGGTIRIELDVVDGGAEIAVVDTGVGIPPEEQERIFEPFYTTKARGTGLGLPLAQRIVNEHGGAVTLSSRPGAGTRVAVRLPLAPAASASPASASGDMMRA